MLLVYPACNPTHWTCLSWCLLLRSPTAQEQVVPNCNSPIGDNKLSEALEYQRKLPEKKEGVKELELFAGDDIFACHEE